MRSFLTLLFAFGRDAPMSASYLCRRRRGFLAAQALFQRIHQIDDVAFLLLFLRHFDRLARGLALDQRLQRSLVLVLEFVRIEFRSLLVEDMSGKIDHVLGYPGLGMSSK